MRQEEGDFDRPFVPGGYTYFQGGWVRYYDSQHPEPVWVRVQPTPEGRLVIRELYLNADNDLGSERIDTDQLRRLSPARIEARLNEPSSKALILERIGQAPGSKEPRGPTERSPMIRGKTTVHVHGEGLVPPPFAGGSPRHVGAASCHPARRAGEASGLDREADSQRPGELQRPLPRPGRSLAPQGVRPQGRRRAVAARERDGQGQQCLGRPGRW